MHRTANIVGYDIFSNPKSELLKKIEKHVADNNSLLTIFTPNAEQIVQAEQNPNFKRHLKQADVLIPDGISLVIASFFLSWKNGLALIQERITGIDLVRSLSRLVSRNDWPVLLVGGRDYDQLFNGVEQVAGCYHLSGMLHWTPGYKDVSQPTQQEERSLQATIQKLRPKVVLVAFGAPQQEQWIVEHRELLAKNQVKLAMAVGGAFDVILGKLKRAPVWMRKLGLEWLFRLIQEPWRWRRQVRLVKFVSLVLRQPSTHKTA